jgi:hypothetical protein
VAENDDGLSLTDALTFAFDFFLEQGKETLGATVDAQVQRTGDSLQRWFDDSINRFQTWIHENLTLPLVESDLIPAEMRDDVRRFTQVPTPASLIPALFFALMGGGAQAKSWLEIFGELHARGIRERHPIHVPGIGDLTQLERLGIITRGDAEETALLNGVSRSWYETLYKGQLVYPQPADVRTLFLREQITEHEHDALLVNLGWSPQAIEAHKVGYRIIPGPSDLIRMAVKEAFRDDFAESWGTDEDFPEEFATWFRRAGGTDFWAQKLWRAHWELPSLTMGFEMLHRGVIDRKQLAFLMRAQDVMPGWREPLLNISYRPYTRVDVRRMYGIGVLGRSDVKRAYLDLGFNEEKAENMTEFTVRYEAGPEKDLTKSEVLRGFREKIFTQSETSALLVNAGYSPGEAHYLITLEQLREFQEIEKLQVDQIKTLYLRRTIADGDVIARLGELGWSGARIDAHLDRLRLQRLERSELPSREDWLRWFKLGMVKEDQVKNELWNLGYDWPHAQLYIDEVKLAAGIA